MRPTVTTELAPVVINYRNPLACALGAVVEVSVIPTAGEALQAVGGSAAVNPLATVLRSMAPDATAREMESEALDLLGGDTATNPLADAVLGLSEPRNQYKRPGQPGNLTSVWVAQNWSRVRPKILESLRRGFPTSNRAGEAEDLLQTWVLKLMDRDHLAPYIALGEPIKVAVLQHWAMQAATSEIRGMGVDAAARTLHGAQTVRERSGTRTTVNSANPVRAAYPKGDRGDGKKPNPTLRDYFDPEATDVEDVLHRQKCLDGIRDALRKGRTPEDGNRYVALFNGMIMGDDRDIRDELAGLSDSRVVSMVATVKRIIASRSAKSSKGAKSSEAQV